MKKDKNGRENFEEINFEAKFERLLRLAKFDFCKD